MLSFTVTVYGINEHAERNAAQRLQAALLRVQELIAGTESLAMLIGQITAEIPRTARRDDEFDVIEGYVGQPDKHDC